MGGKVIELIKLGIPIILMIFLIPFVANDYFLTLIYSLTIFTTLLIKRDKKDVLFLVFGFVIMTLCEYLFISTGVEKFERNSLFGVMPLWLPLLWAYAFVSMKRGILILGVKDE